MKKQIIAIGGGGFGRSQGEGIIEKYILDQSNKKNQIYVLYLQQLEIMKPIRLTTIPPSLNLIALQSILISSKELRI